MDFARIDPRRSAENAVTWEAEFDGELLFHNDEKIEMDFLGVDSATGRRAAAGMARRADRKNAQSGKNKSLKDMTEDQILEMARQDESNRAQFYADLCTGWRNVPFISDDKIDDAKAKPELLPFSPENALMLFKSRPWMLSGIDAFLANKGNWQMSVDQG